jgi:hypothetical protein
VEIIHVAPGNPRIEFLQQEPLRTEWFDDAESQHERGVAYLMVLARDPAGLLVPAAWAGYRIEDEAGRVVLRCCNNYVRREFRGRTPDLYAVAYRARHDRVVRRFGLHAVTYLFPEPIPLHEADGWVRDTSAGGSGTSRARPDGELHHWQRLRWSPR